MGVDVETWSLFHRLCCIRKMSEKKWRIEAINGRLWSRNSSLDDVWILKSIASFLVRQMMMMMMASTRFILIFFVYICC